MINKKLIFTFLVLFNSSIMFAEYGIKTSKLMYEEFSKKYLWNEKVKETIINELKISDDDDLISHYENIYEISYMAYTPIILIYYDHQLNFFNHEMYVIICTVDENKNLKHIDFQKCESRKIEEILIEQK